MYNIVKLTVWGFIMNDSLSSFRRENVFAVYELIKRPGKLKRTEIAEYTQISLPTVTKIVDTFCKSGMVRLSKYKENGRVPKYVSLHPEKYCVIFDLSCESFKSYIVNLRGEIMTEYVCSNLIYGPPRMIDEKTYIHIKGTIDTVNYKYKKYNCFGYGFLLPGHFDPQKKRVISPRFPRIYGINFPKLIEQFKLDKTTVLCDIRECYAQSAISRTENGQSSMIIYFDLNDISTGYLVRGHTSPPLKYAPFGKAVIRGGHTLESICREIQDPHQVAPIFAEEIFELSKKLPIDNVFIMGNRYSPMLLFAKVVSEEFEAYRNNERTFLPSIKFDTGKLPHIPEIAAKIRDKHYLEQS